MRRPPARDADQEAVRKAAASVTRQISIATLGLVVLIVILAVATVIVQSQPKELAEKQAPGETKIYIDAGAVLVALAVIGVGAILFAALVSWLIARRAVQPLGRALQLQRTFVADASHELRTPLAVLDARLQLLARRLAPDDPNAQTVEELRHDTGALIGIVNELLEAAGGSEAAEPGTVTDASAAAAEPGTVTDASAAAADAVSALRLLAEPRDVTIRLETVEGATVTMPETSFRRCVTALVDNAIAHTADGGVIEVTVDATEGAVTLSVADHGPGIRGIDPARVFDRFAHSDPDGAGGTAPRRGFGIGLALVRDVAARNGGTVRVDRTGPDGTTITLELPRA